ncbi:hypothetical protein ACCT30_36260 [Rhizobium ruizarguesonis]
METLLHGHASSGPSELGRFGEEYTAKMTGRQNNPPEKRHGSEMQFMVQSVGARLPQTQGAVTLGVSVNRSRWSISAAPSAQRPGNLTSLASMLLSGASARR